MDITSTAVQANGNILKDYTCDGDDINPPLTFSEVPKEAKSLVFIMDDPDAPGGVFTHWIIYDMSPATLQIPENSLTLTGKLGRNDFGRIGYGGPCPPSGEHRYRFRLFALDNELDLPEGESIQRVIDALDKVNVIEEAELTATYEKAS